VWAGICSFSSKVGACLGKLSRCHRRLRSTLSLVSVAMVLPLCLPAQIPDGFNPGPNNMVQALAIQADNKVLVGGLFLGLGGTTQPYLARLNPDGSLDTNFLVLPQMTSRLTQASISAISVQADGRILVAGLFGSINGLVAGSLARLSSDGVVDTTFSTNAANGTIWTLYQQRDGQILVGGAFLSRSRSSASYLERLHPDGTVDTNFLPKIALPPFPPRPTGPNGAVYCLAEQPDGKILIGGDFTSFAMLPCNRLARLNPDGTVENAFGPGADGSVRCLAVQPDGKILAGGSFTNVLGSPRACLARLNPDGSLDAGFAPSPDAAVQTIGLQADGKILVGGLFKNIAGRPQSCLARLNSDGSLDATFTNLFTSAADKIWGLMLQPDGRVLIGGTFNNVAGQVRTNLARLVNTSAPTNQLTFDGSTINWARDGTAPEFASVVFDASTNGTDWIELGQGSRSGGGWGLAGLNLSANATIRGRGLVTGGFLNGSSWYEVATTGQPGIIEEPADSTNAPGTVAQFSVRTVGSAPFSFQWFKDGVPLANGGKIFGPDQATLSISNVFGEEAGSYFAVIANNAGSVTSHVASLTVLDPLVTTQPSSVAALVGQTVSFQVSVAGTQPIRFQWRKDGSSIAGATTASLVLTNVQVTDAAHYDVVVSNVFATAFSSVAVLTINQATLDSFSPAPNGTVQTTALQSDGKLLVGGNFSTLSGQSCYFLGRLNSDGSLDTGFQPKPNGPVTVVAVQPNGKILIAGQFSSIGGQSGTGLARLNADGTTDTSFNASIGGVNAIALQPDGKIIVGGSFQGANNTAMTSICRLTPTGGLDSGFQTSTGINGPVRALAVQSDGRIVVGGLFWNWSGNARAGIARLLSDGSVDATFNPGVGLSNNVDCLTLQPDGKILAGGSFTLVDGRQQNHLARLNPDGTIDANFTGSANALISSIVLQANGKIIVGGQFTSLGTANRKYLGRLYSDGSVDPLFDPAASFVVNSLALQQDGKLVAGGTFTTIGTHPVAYLARLNPTDTPDESLTLEGNTLTWLRGGGSPEVVGTLFEVSSNGTTFNSLGPGVRIPGGWQMSSPVLVSNVSIRVSGFFSGGQFDGSMWSTASALGPPVITGEPSSILANAGSSATFTVQAIGSPALFYQWRRNGDLLPGATAGSFTLTNVSWADSGTSYDVIVSNVFGSVTSTPAMLTANLAVPDSLNPAADTAVRSIAIQPDGKILLGGDFSVLGTHPQSNIGRLNADGSVDTAFAGSANGSVSFLGVREDARICVNGNFQLLDNQPRSYLGRLDQDGNLESFAPNLPGGPGSLALDAEGNLLVGTSGYNSASIVRFLGDDSLDPSFNIGVTSFASPLVSSMLVLSNGQVIVTGIFDSLAGHSCNGFARLNADGQVDSSFQVSFGGGQVICMAPQADGKLLIGGDFTSVNRMDRQHIARLNADGAVDPDFNPGADGQVSSLVVQANGKILAGGWFTTLGGQSPPYLARLNVDGSLDPGFSPFPDTGVFAIAIQKDGKIVAGGYFTRIGGQSRGCAARLLNSDAATESLSFDGSTITWLRGGGSPEIWACSFDLSPDGIHWMRLGQGNRISGGWQLPGITIVRPCLLRARGFIPTGNGSAAGWFVETITPVTPPSILANNSGFGLRSNLFAFDFAGFFQQTVAIDWSTNLLNWNSITTNALGTAPLTFSDAVHSNVPAQFYRLRVVPR